MGRLTERDLEITRFLGRVKIARPEQVALRFSIGRSTSYERLAILAEFGLADSAENVAPTGRVWFATAAGLKECGFGFPPLKPTVGAVTHDLGATQLIAELEAGDVPCLAEREIRAYTREVQDDRYSFAVNDHTAGKLIRHTPDVVCEIPDEDRFYAIELELTRKVALRWRDILTGFQTRLGINGFGGVYYLTNPHCRPAHLARLAGEAGLDKHFQLQLVDQSNPLDALKALIAADTF
jgi:hypothetical protein